MNDQHIRIIQHYTGNETVLNPFALLILVVMSILLLKVNRKNAIIPLVVIALFITTRQRFVIVGLDFTMLRIITVVGILRIFIRHEYKKLQINTLDTLVIIWTISKIITYTLLHKSGAAFVNRLGNSLDVLGLYFFCRTYLCNVDEIKELIKFLIIASIPISIFMILEQINGSNLFHYFGGVPEITMIRHGQLRSQGAFSHPILAGTFGAFLLPLSIGQYHVTRNKIYLSIGILTSSVIVFTSSSSGPLLAYLSSILGLFIYKYRRYVPLLIWTAVSSLLILNIIMKAPVWHLITRISILTGSTAYHRYRLIEAAIDHFHEWWLIGTNRTAYWGWGLQDITNQYIYEATSGGLISLIAFLLILFLSFKFCWKYIRALESIPEIQKFIWGIGCSLFVHAISFFSVTYFGQLIFFKYLTIAIISNFKNYMLPKKIGHLYDIIIRVSIIRKLQRLWQKNEVEKLKPSSIILGKRQP